MIGLLLVLSLGTASGQTIFEGFYRIERERRHAGFLVQRYRREGNARVLTTYLRLRQADGVEVYETYKSTTRADGTPVASEYRGTATGLPAVFARFTGGRGRVDFGVPRSRRPASVEKYDLIGSFLFLVGNLPALEAGRVYRYRAFAEERGSVQTGTLHVAAVSDVRGLKVYRMLDDALGEPIENFVAANGQPLGSRALGGDSVVYWVPSREDALGEFKYPDRDVIALFGDLPAGKANAWAALPDFRADEVIHGFPKWTGRRVLTPAALAKTAVLPRRAL